MFFSGGKRGSLESSSKDFQGPLSKHCAIDVERKRKGSKGKVVAVPFEHFQGTRKGSPFYGRPRPFAEMMAGLSDRRLQSMELPAGWLVQSWNGWEGWTPRDWAPRMQGWKIHVSATPECAVETLARTTRICVDAGVSFKFCRRWLS